MRVIRVSPDSRSFTVELEGRRETLRYVPLLNKTGAATENAEPPTILLAHGSNEGMNKECCFFDLKNESVTGELTLLAEDLRDYFRRRAIRFFTDRPFKTLPLANLQRLKRRASEGKLRD